MTPIGNLKALTLFCAGLAACCGQSGTPTPSRYGGSPAEAPPGSASTAAEPSGESWVGDASSSSAPAPSSDAAPEGYTAKRAEERPGLGTEWGETQTSRVTTVSFERQDWSNPAAVTTLYYNDSAGVQAMTRGAALGAFASTGARAYGGALTVRLIDASGSPLPTFDFGPRTYVVGNHGESYRIQIRNNTPSRIEAVATVDGLDVMDGRDGSFEKRGYLIAPWSTLEIDGFRQSLDEVAAFRFGSVGQSYAARKGDARNVGVIGIAFFMERGSHPLWLEREAERRHRAAPFPSRFASPPP